MGLQSKGFMINYWSSLSILFLLKTNLEAKFFLQVGPTLFTNGDAWAWLVIRYYSSNCHIGRIWLERYTWRGTCTLIVWWSSQTQKQITTAYIVYKVMHVIILFKVHHVACIHTPIQNRRYYSSPLPIFSTMSAYVDQQSLWLNIECTREQKKKKKE